MVAKNFSMGRGKKASVWRKVISCQGYYCVAPGTLLRLSICSCNLGAHSVFSYFQEILRFVTA